MSVKDGTYRPRQNFTIKSIPTKLTTSQTPSQPAPPLTPSTPPSRATQTAKMPSSKAPVSTPSHSPTPPASRPHGTLTSKKRALSERVSARSLMVVLPRNLDQMVLICGSNARPLRRRLCVPRGRKSECAAIVYGRKTQDQGQHHEGDQA